GGLGPPRRGPRARFRPASYHAGRSGTVSLAEILPATAFPVLLVFARVGSALMVLPGIGDLYVPQRWRLLLAMALAGIVAGVVGPSLPALPASPATLLALLF